MRGQDIRETYLEAGEYFASVVDQVDIDGWEALALGEWCVRDLVGHTYRSFTTVLSYSEKPADKIEIKRRNHPRTAWMRLQNLKLKLLATVKPAKQRLSHFGIHSEEQLISITSPTTP